MAIANPRRVIVLAALAALFAIPAPLLLEPSVPGLATPVVLADDDAFGGDDDDDDDDVTSSNSADDDDWVATPQRPPRNQPALPTVRPDAASDEIVAYGLTAESLALLLETGFILRADDALPDLGILVRLRVPPGQSVTEALAQVALLVPEATAAPNNYYYNQAEPSACDAALCELWPLVGWPTSDDGFCAAAPLIGVVDTGVNTRHEVLEGADVLVERFIETTDTPSEARHGTAVVAMFVGAPGSRVPGLLPKARIRVADPFAGVGGVDRADTYALTRAIVHLLEIDADVINLSLAGADNAILAGIVALAGTKDIPLVAAVGNAGANAPPLYPAAYDSVLAVTAVDSRMRIYRRAVQGSHVDIAAPGVEIPTAASISGVRPYTGTSFAAPFVTAALAAAMSASPALPGVAVQQALLAAAQDLGEPGRDDMFGWGLLHSGPSCTAPSP